MLGDGLELPQIRGILESLLRIATYRELEHDFEQNPKLRKLFDLTGTATRSEIQKRLHLDNTVIAKTWESWHDRGLLRKVGKSYQKTWGE